MGTTTLKSSQHKSPMVVLLLCLFLGLFGAHRFYVKKYGTGVLMLVTLGAFGLWALIDLIFIVLNKFEDSDGNVIMVSKKPTAFKKLAMVIGSIIASAWITVAAFYGVVIYSTSGLVQVANAQLQALNAGDISKAYSFTSERFRNGMPVETFSTFVKSFPILSQSTKATFTSRAVNYEGRTMTGKLEGTIQSHDGAKAMVRYRFIKEHGDWKIEELNIIQDASQVHK